MSHPESSSSAPYDTSSLVTLENKVAGVEGKLSEIVYLIMPWFESATPAAAAITISTTTGLFVSQTIKRALLISPQSPSRLSEWNKLQLTLPPSTAENLNAAFPVCRAYLCTVKHNKFENTATLSPFPAIWFIPEMVDSLEGSSQLIRGISGKQGSNGISQTTVGMHLVVLTKSLRPSGPGH